MTNLGVVEALQSRLLASVLVILAMGLQEASVEEFAKIYQRTVSFRCSSVR